MPEELKPVQPQSSELNAQESLYQEKREEFAEQLKNFKQNYTRTIVSEVNKYASSSSVLSSFTAAQVARFLQNPTLHEKELRQLSNYIYSISGTYRAVIQFFANLPKYRYTLNPVSVPDKIDKEKYRKAYFKVAKEVDKLNLSHEMLKAMKVAFKEDVFYGYTIEDKNSFFILNLKADYCKLSSIEEGLYNFAFDFSFFDRQEELLNSYPEEFRRKYLVYKSTNEKFIELDSNRTIVLKVNEELEYPLIPYSSVFEAIFDLDEYKKIKKQKTKMDNFLLLNQQIPQGDKNEVDVFTVSLDTADYFHQMLSDAMRDSGVAVTTSPMKLEAVRMERSKNDTDTVNQASRDIFNDASVPQQLFNSDKNNSAGINKAIILSEQIAFGMLRQIERWVNRRLNKRSGLYKFNVKLLDITEFNKTDVQDSYHKAASSGLPVVSDYAASLGLTPMELHNKAVLENDVLEIHDKLTPLASAHTQSSKDKEAGREKKEDGTESDSTERWRETSDAQGD